MTEKTFFTQCNDSDVLNNKAKRCMLERSKTCAATPAIVGQPKPSKNSKSWTTIKFSDYPKASKRKRRTRAPLPPIKPTREKMFPVYTPPGTPHRTARRADAKFRSRAPYVLDRALESVTRNSTVNPVTAAQSNRIREPSFLDDLLRFSEPFTDEAVNIPNNTAQDNSSNHAPEFVDAPEARTEPEYSDIKELCDRYYPHLLKQHSPSSHHKKSCSNSNCKFENETPCYICTCCFKRQWLCKGCTVEHHQNNPFHRIKKWDEESFTSVNVSLESLGLIIHLDRLDEQICSCGQTDKYVREIEVIHSNGFHRIKYSLCNCNDYKKTTPTASPEQLLTAGLYPATSKSPRRAFTFDVLAEYDVLNLFAFVNIKRFLDSKSYMAPPGFQCSEEVSEYNCFHKFYFV